MKDFIVRPCSFCLFTKGEQRELLAVLDFEHGYDKGALLRADRPAMAAANAVLSVLAGVIAVWAGVTISERGSR